MTRLTLALILFMLAAPVAAHAQATQTKAPPGNSAIDEYLETVPGATGNTRPGGPSAKGGGSALTAAQRARLERLGPDGKALAKAVDSTASAPRKSSAEATLSPGKGRSPAREVIGAVSGSDGGGGMGLLLPIILFSALLAAITVVLLRRRAAS